MENRTDIPSSFSKWDKKAKLGLVSICVLLVFLVTLSPLLKTGGETSATSSGFIPNDAVNTVLPQDKLNELKALLTPLFRGNVSAFDGVENAGSGEIVASLLSHLCETKGIEEDETGAKTVLAEDVDELYSALFSVASPKGSIQNGKVARYDSGSGAWLFYGSEYFPEYELNILSTYTLGNAVYVQIDVVKPLDVPSEIPSETESEVESEVDETVSDTVTSAEDAPSDVVTSEEEVSSEEAVSSEEEISSEDVTVTEKEYTTVRSVFVTISVTEGKYTVTQIRNA